MSLRLCDMGVEEVERVLIDLYAIRPVPHRPLPLPCPVNVRPYIVLHVVDVVL